MNNEYKAELYDKVYDLNKDHKNPYFVELALVFKREAMKIRAETKNKTDKSLGVENGCAKIDV